MDTELVDTALSAASHGNRQGFMPTVKIVNGTSFQVVNAADFDPATMSLYADLTPWGSCIFVDGVGGSDANAGTLAKPVKTIMEALSRAVAGSQIFVAPGLYNENLVLTGKNDITVIGQGCYGRAITSLARPSVVGTGKALTLNQCRRISFVGLYLYSADDVAVKLDSEACSFINCETSSDVAEEYQLISDTDPEFTGSGTTWLRCILDSGVNGIKNYVRTAPNGIGQATNCVVEDCDFYGHSAADIADPGAEALNQPLFDSWRITKCRFMTRNKVVYLAMNSGARGDASTNCLISGCFFADDGGLDATKINLPVGAVFTGNFDAKGVKDGSAL